MAHTEKSKPLINSAMRRRAADGQLLLPSWGSLVASLVFSLAVVIGTVLALYYQASDFRQLRSLQQAQASSVTQNYQQVGDGLEHNTFVSNIPLLVFWGVVGMIVYSFVMSLLRAVENAVELEQEMHYVHPNHALRRLAFIRLALRVGAAVALFLYLKVTLKIIVPYVIALVYAGTAPEGVWVNSVYMVSALVVMAACLHGYVILARLLTLRARLV